MKKAIIVLSLLILCSCKSNTYSHIEYVTLDEAKYISKNTLDQYLIDNEINKEYSYNKYLNKDDSSLYTGNVNDIIISYVDSSHNEILILVSSDKMNSYIIDISDTEVVNADYTQISGYYKYEGDTNYYEITDEGFWLYYNDKDEDVMSGEIVYKDNNYVLMIDDIDMLVLKYDDNKFIDESDNILIKFEK